MIDYLEQCNNLTGTARVKMSDVLPADWAKERLIMGKPFPGPFKYKGRTPYTEEIINCLAPDHPARIIAFKKGAQFGGTAGIVMPFLGWMIENQPGNTIFTVGHESLVPEAMDKLDIMLDATGVRRLIRPTAQRARATKTGDTNTRKEFPLGYIKVSSASNHKIFRQADYQYGCIDDYEAIKAFSKESGSTFEMIMQRFAAYADTMKLLLMSTPEREETSNIQPAFLMGDQREWFVDCPCCHKFIMLKWSVQVDDKNTAGIVWKQDGDGRIIKDSVGYVCQSCGQFFDDRNKTKLIDSGEWRPTAKPMREGCYSYHASSLLAPIGMRSWFDYVNMYVSAHMPGQPRDEAIYKTFVNLCLAETYSEPAESMNASSLQKNTSEYKPGVIPEALSRQQGNGEIVMLTIAADMNGTVLDPSKGFIHDARLDYEVLAHSESGSTYSILQGSIGTFVPGERNKKFVADRKKWTYELNQLNSVWPELDRIIDMKFSTDTGRQMTILTAALDCGHYSTGYAYPYLEQQGGLFFGVKGDKEDSFMKLNVDVPKFKMSSEMRKLYIVKVGMYKDKLSELFNLKFDSGQDKIQPPGYCNFPHPRDGMYEYVSYFEHFEAEEKVPKKDSLGRVESYIWRKKSSTAQNHFFDCRIYNMAVRDIIVHNVCTKRGLKNYTWKDFANLMLGK